MVSFLRGAQTGSSGGEMSELNRPSLIRDRRNGPNQLIGERLHIIRRRRVIIVVGSLKRQLLVPLISRSLKGGPNLRRQFIQ